MKNFTEFLYGKESSEKMKLFKTDIQELNDKHKEILNGEEIESKFFVNWTAGKNVNMLQITDNKLDYRIKNDINGIFNKHFNG